MTVSAVTTLSRGDIDAELALLEEEAENLSDDAEIYIRISQIYRIKQNYKVAWSFLQKADKLIR
jgi:hypothetical protein